MASNYSIALIQKYLNEPSTALQVFALTSVTERLKSDYGVRWEEKTRVFLLPEITFTTTMGVQPYNRGLSDGVSALGSGAVGRTYKQVWRAYAPNIDDSFDFIIDKLSLSESGWEESLVLVLREWSRQHKIPNLDRKVLANIFGGAIGTDNAGNTNTVAVFDRPAETIQVGTTGMLAILNEIDGYLADQKVGDEEEVFFYCVPEVFRAILGDTALVKHLSVVENEGKVMTNIRQYNRFQIIRVPTDYLPAKANFLVVPKSAVLYGLKFDIANIYDSDSVPIKDASGNAHIGLEAVGHIYGFAGVLNTKAHAVITSSYGSPCVTTVVVKDSEASTLTGSTVVIKKGAVIGSGDAVTATSTQVYSLDWGYYNFSVAKDNYVTETGVFAITGGDIATGTKTLNVILASDEG
ncbi:MAG: hypothetical protein RBS91_10410 [Sulfurimonadaceae bacterium]|jgi:hypothetical protein|nr:hypothetical protein [Sulfurimonadaceae bacterium]